MIMFPIYVKEQLQKVSAMARVFPFMLVNQHKIILNTTLMSQFGYCLLVCMNHNKTSTNRINSLHERAIRLVCNDFKSSFHQLLEKDDY